MKYGEILIGWEFPKEDWIKCNVDGACCNDGMNVACGGVFRDATGTWILGFSKYLGSCNSVQAELEGLVAGLKIARQKGLRRIWYEMDSRTAVRLVNKGCQSSHPLAGLVEMARRLLNLDWDVRLSFSHRESNTLADWLAGDAVKKKNDLTLFDVPLVVVVGLCLLT